jgi:hypothetical protein
MEYSEDDEMNEECNTKEIDKKNIYKIFDVKFEEKETLGST